MSWTSVAADLLAAAEAESQWPRIARPEQLPPPGDWGTWAFIAGRGAGKTRSGAEQVAAWAREDPGCRIALIGPTAADVRDVMIDGESGLLAVCPGIAYEPSKRRVVWPNGSRAYAYSAEEPARLRGPQHGYLWADEGGCWSYASDTWAMAQLGLRLGKRPRAIMTTTPRPTKLLRELVARDGQDVRVTRCNTYANAANLPPSFLEAIKAQYEGTRIGRQELHAELLDDVEGALWTRAMIDDNRVRVAPELVRVVVAIDPAVTATEGSDETGIVVAGQGAADWYVLADYSGKYSPDGWARKACWAFEQHKADRIVAETNNGGDLVEHTLRTIGPRIPYSAVHASRGKRTRAEPIAALFEQGRVHMVGEHKALETQLCSWSGDSDESPDRLDALVWVLTELAKPANLRSYSEWRTAAYGVGGHPDRAGHAVRR